MSFSYGRYGIGVHTLENKFSRLIKGKHVHLCDEEILILGATPGKVALYLGQTMTGVIAVSYFLTKPPASGLVHINIYENIQQKCMDTHKLVKECNSTLHCSSKLQISKMFVNRGML